MKEMTLLRMTFLLLVAMACVGPAAAHAAEPSAPPAEPLRLFVIERSKNANIVCYDAHLAPDGKLDPKQPVVAYWIMLAEKGQREELNWIEKKKAYGFTIKQDSAAGGYLMTVVASPERSIIVKTAGDVIRAEMVIDGHASILEKMFINSTDKLLGPKVNFIELHGKDLETGEKRYEKIVPK